MKQIKHYQIVEKLASGGMGEVHRAFDSVLEREVAIKVMHRHLLDNTVQSERFIREAQIAAKLVHPNVVTIYEVGRRKVGPYIVMELVKGTPLSRLQKQKGSYEPEDVIRITTQVLDGVQCAHSLGILHRDIKPDNILITDDGQAKILDFGIAKLSSKVGLTVAGDLLGTVEYMAPEQLMGEPLDHRADLYAVGVVVYQLLTNQLPFPGESPAGMLYKQLNEDALPPSYHNEKIGKGLDEVVLRALSKERDERWDSAQSFSDALQSLLKTEVAVPQPDQFADNEDVEDVEPLTESKALSKARNRLGSVFIGRKEELKKLIALYKKCSQGRGQTVIIKGEAGVGKSTLAEQLRSYATRNNGRVLYGACLYHEGMDPYLPYIDALRNFFSKEHDLLPEHERLELKEIIRKRIPVLLEFTERFTTNFGPMELTEEDSKQDSPNLLNGIYYLIAHICTNRPVVLIIDDLHWADEASLRLFHYISRYVAQHRWMLVGISRTDQYDLVRDGKPAAVVDVLARIRQEGTCEEIRIRRLTQESCEALIDKALSPSFFTEEFYKRIYNETKGNPLFIGETLKQLCENGGIYLENGNWHHKEHSLELTVPNRIEDIFLRRLSGLNKDEREILQVLAIQGYKFDPRLALNLLNTGRMELLKTLQRIEREIQLISSAEKGYHFEHPMVRDLLYNEVASALRKEYHLMYAEELEKIHGPNYGALVGDVAQHLRRGDDHNKAVPLLYKAAVRAFGLSAYREASLFFTDLLDSIEKSNQTVSDCVSESDLYFKLGICYEESGHWDESLDAYTKLLSISERDQEYRRQTDALLRLGRIRGKLGDWELAMSKYKCCVKLATDHALENVLSRAFNNIGIIYFQKGEFDTAMEYFEKTIEAVDCKLGEFDKAHALANMGILSSIRGDHSAALENYKKALEIYERKGNRPRDEGRIYHNIGMSFADRGEWDKAIEAFNRCLKLADAVEDRQLHSLTHLNLGKTYERQNRLSKAKTYTERALKNFKKMGDTLNMAEAYHVLGLIHSSKGSPEIAEKFFVASLEINERMGYEEGLAETYMSYGHFCEKQEQRERAISCYEKARQVYQKLVLEGKVEALTKMVDELKGNAPAAVEVVDINLNNLKPLTNCNEVHHS